MPRWLAEEPTTVYTILGALALIVLALGWKFRDHTIPIGSGKDRRKPPRSLSALALSGLIVALLAALAGGVRLIDYLVITDREQIEQAVREMAAGVNERNTERVFRHVARTFRSPSGRN